MDDFDMIQEKHYAELEAMEQKLANRLGVPVECARAVSYLRTRSRWTQEMEDRLIQSYKDPNQTPVPIEKVLSGEWR